MPTFDLDLDVDDILYEMSIREKKEMYKALKDDLGEEKILETFIEGVKINIPQHPSLMDEVFLKALLNIFNNRNKLTLEEEEEFINFSKKF